MMCTMNASTDSESDSDSAGPSPEQSPTAMRRLIPEDVLERSAGCPFDPAPGLEQRRGQGSVQPLELLNGAVAWW